MADPSFAVLQEVLDELYRKNGGQAPTAKQMAAATLLSVKEAQLILDELQGESTCPEPKPKKAKKEKREKQPQKTESTASSAKDPPPSQAVDKEAALSAVPPGAFEEADSDEELAYGAAGNAAQDEVGETQCDESDGAGTPPYSPSLTSSKLRRAKSTSTLLRGQAMLRGGSGVQIVNTDEEPKEVFDDRLPEPDSWDKLRHAPTLRFGETGEELPDEDLAHDADAEAECEAEAVQQATARHDAEMAKQAEEVANGKPPPLVPEVAVPPAPAPVAAEAVAVPTEPVGPVTSTTHRKQLMALQRVVQGPRASAFPEITKLFGSGTKAERLKVLKTYVQNGENLQAVESAFRASRTHSETMRQKIAGCVARGGIADRDAPNCQNSTKYWASVVTEETTTDDSTMSVEVGGSIRASDAMGAFLVPGNHVGTQVSVADPLALVRQQMAASTAAPATPASDQAAPVGNGNMRPKAKPKAKSVPQPKGPPLSDIALAGKTVTEKEAKKELSQLGSLKLDMPDGNARFKDGLSRIEKNVQRLTTFFSRLQGIEDEAAFSNIRVKLGEVAESRMTRAELGAVLKEFKKPACLV
ncbi:unnamed protein product [Cladocopium goreaui]|uniref:Uncharacterized protein n=1 Tax=Cladocopium goreaui TaxID=2562237 RepID=A0A9P1C2E2_9DINO|nr:unnamed protein product [Cladocopium goreaui]